MTNIVSEWRRQITAKDGNITKACETLSMICCKDINPSRVGEFENGKRQVPDCIHFLMLNTCLPDLLKDAGFEYTGGKSSVDWAELIDSLMPPKRK